jgi:hypothetical protein
VIYTTDQLLAEIASGLGLTLRAAAALQARTRRRRREEGETTLPTDAAPRPVSPSCVFRWVQSGVSVPGVGRVRLEAARCAGKILTTPQALQRFIAAQNGQIEAAAPPVRSPARREAGHAAAAEKLAKMGIE